MKKFIIKCRTYLTIKKLNELANAGLLAIGSAAYMDLINMDWTHLFTQEEKNKILLAAAIFKGTCLLVRWITTPKTPDNEVQPD